MNYFKDKKIIAAQKQIAAYADKENCDLDKKWIKEVASKGHDDLRLIWWLFMPADMMISLWW